MYLVIASLKGQIAHPNFFEDGVDALEYFIMARAELSTKFVKHDRSIALYNGNTLVTSYYYLRGQEECAFIVGHGRYSTMTQRETVSVEPKLFMDVS